MGEANHTLENSFWFNPVDTIVHETLRPEIARRSARPVPGRSSCARFPQHADAGEWRTGGLTAARRGRVALARTSRVPRQKNPPGHGADVTGGCRANAAGEHPVAGRKTKGRAARGSVGPQPFSGAGGEPSPARVEPTALADDRPGQTAGDARGDSGAGGGSCR